MIFRLLYYSYFNSKVYFLLLTFVMVENTKTGSETKSLTPNTLTALSGNSIAIILAPANIIVAIPVTIQVRLGVLVGEMRVAQKCDIFICASLPLRSTSVGA